MLSRKDNTYEMEQMLSADFLNAVLVFCDLSIKPLFERWVTFFEQGFNDLIASS